MFLSTLLTKTKTQHRQLAVAASHFLTAQPVRMFAATPPPAEEVAKAKEEWGEKYSDECFTFEKEW